MCYNVQSNTVLSQFVQSGSQQLVMLTVITFLQLHTPLPISSISEHDQSCHQFQYHRFQLALAKLDLRRMFSKYESLTIMATELNIKFIT